MTILVGENWSGSGSVNGKTPSSGGGTWVSTVADMTYGGGLANPNGNFNITPAFHSVTYTDTKFNAVVYPGLTGPSYANPVIIYARASVNNDPYPNCYYVTCKEYSSSGAESVSLSKRVSGVETELFNVTASTFGATVSFEVNGTALKVYINGSLIIDTTDSSITSAGYSGFGLNYNEVGEDTGESTVGTLTIETVAAAAVSTSSVLLS
jgi:hypothetical protein